MSAATAYSALLDARSERGLGVDGLLLKEKLGGKSVISHSLDRFDEDERCSEVLVLAAPAVHDWIAHDPLTFASGKLKLLDPGLNLAGAFEAARDPVVVYHDARRPNWTAPLLDSLLRAWQPGEAALPGRPLDGELLRRGGMAGESGSSPTVAEDFFGGHKASATAIHSVAERLDQAQYCQLESPQVWDARALGAALAGQSIPAGLAEVGLAAGIRLSLLPARPHNFLIADSDGLHLMRRLLGETKKPGKDKYGGLGW